MLVDLERRRVVDLLPDREAATLATWLQVHPGVAFVSRDRGAALPRVRDAVPPTPFTSPTAITSCTTLVQALERVCVRHQAALRDAAHIVEPVDERSAHGRREDGRVRAFAGLPSNQRGPTQQERLNTERRARCLARYDKVARLAAQVFRRSRSHGTRA